MKTAFGRALTPPPTNHSTVPDSAASREWRCTTPVALFIFNRPDTTRRVLDAIRQVKPAVLYVFADGPRANVPEDTARCAAARAWMEEIDWDCAVRKDYAGQNLGIKRRVESGLDWVFADEDAAILLEDDCVAHPTFFRFCEELLARYCSEDRILTISGTDLTSGDHLSPYSYRFSRYLVPGGLAMWRRAWRLYDPEMRTWTRSLHSKWLEGYLGDVRTSQYWSYIFNTEYTTHENWDYAWTYSAWQNDGLCIHPNVNLISNIGFGPDATHTINPNDSMANLPVKALPFPLRHPETIRRDADADMMLEANIYSGTLTRMLARVRRLQLQERAAQDVNHPG
jgi:hypothetical protein